MRILFLCNSPFWGGAEKYVVDVASGLTARGHRCWVAASPDSRLLAEVDATDGVDGLTIDLGPKLGARTAFDMVTRWHVYRARLRSMLQESIRCFGIEAVHFQFKKEQLLGTGVAAKLGLPVVWSEHDQLPVPFARFQPALELYRRVARTPRRILCVSNFVRQNLLGHGVRADSLEVCYNGIDTPTVPTRGARTLARRALGLAPEDFVVGTTSRLYRIKGQHILLDAVPSLIAQQPNLRVVIVGDGPARTALQTQAEQLGIAKCVTFTGHRADVNNVLAAMDVLAAPTLSEGLCYAVLEAMALAIPVVASRVGGVPEAVGTRGAGVLVEPGNTKALVEAIAGLASNEPLRVRMGAAGRQRILSTFTKPLMMDGTEKIFRAALRPDLRITPASRGGDAFAAAS